MATHMNYDFMPGMADSSMSAYGGANNEDLDDILDLAQNGGQGELNSGGMNNMFDFGSGGIFTPNGMNVNGGMMQGSVGNNNMLQPQSSSSTNHGLPQYDLNSSGFPFSVEVDPSIIMGSAQTVTGTQRSGTLPNFSDNYGQLPSTVFPRESTLSVKNSQDPEEPVPKPKRTRQSKKKRLTPEQEEKKRKEFLERNRQAASKCRTRKQEATAALQAKSQSYAHHNAEMKHIVDTLESEIAELRNKLLAHVNCNDSELQAAVERYQSMHRNGSVYGDHDSPARPHSSHSFVSMPSQSMGSPGMGMDVLNSGPATPTLDIGKTSSGLSSTSQNPYNADGLYNLNSPHVPNQMLYGSRKEELASEYRPGNPAAQDKYEIAMSRRSSKSSSCSTGSSSRNDASEYASSITTPETLTKENSARAFMGRATTRGMPRKLFGNPRIESSIDSYLPNTSSMEVVTQ